MPHQFLDAIARRDRDPVEDSAVSQFDFESIADRIDGIRRIEPDLGVALRELFDWCIKMDRNAIPPDKRALIAGRRIFVLCWSLGILGNISLRDLGEYLHTQHQRLGEIAVRIPRELRFRSSRQVRKKSAA